MIDNAWVSVCVYVSVSQTFIRLHPTGDRLNEPTHLDS